MPRRANPLHFMISFLPRSPRDALTVLALGAHCDDIEIGCGATLAALARAYPNARFVWITLSSDPLRAAETRAAADALLPPGVDKTVRIESFRGSYFPHCGEALKDCFETFKAYAPDLVFTHCRHDLHQDHRVVNELTWNTFRDHAVLEYEIAKYDGDLGTPNVFMPLTRQEVDHKCRVLMDAFPSQHARTWFTPETFSALARLRGVECNAPGGYAEAFFGRKIRLTL
jgi:LmbE family N-acetylglucosaminyl deacetylase